MCDAIRPSFDAKSARKCMRDVLLIPFLLTDPIWHRRWRYAEWVHGISNYCAVKSVTTIARYVMRCPGNHSATALSCCRRVRSRDMSRAVFTTSRDCQFICESPSILVNIIKRRCGRSYALYATHVHHRRLQTDTATVGTGLPNRLTRTLITTDTHWLLKLCKKNSLYAEI